MDYVIKQHLPFETVQANLLHSAFLSLHDSASLYQAGEELLAVMENPVDLAEHIQASQALKRVEDALLLHVEVV